MFIIQPYLIRLDFLVNKTILLAIMATTQELLFGPGMLEVVEQVGSDQALGLLSEAAQLILNTRIALEAQGYDPYLTLCEGVQEYRTVKVVDPKGNVVRTYEEEANYKIEHCGKKGCNTITKSNRIFVGERKELE